MFAGDKASVSIAWRRFAKPWRKCAGPDHKLALGFALKRRSLSCGACEHAGHDRRPNDFRAPTKSSMVMSFTGRRWRVDWSNRRVHQTPAGRFGPTRGRSPACHRNCSGSPDPSQPPRRRRGAPVRSTAFAATATLMKLKSQYRCASLGFHLTDRPRREWCPPAPSGRVVLPPPQKRWTAIRAALVEWSERAWSI